MLKCLNGALMLLIQSAQADLNLSKLLAEEPETDSEFQVLIDRENKEQVKANTLHCNCLYL